ncbi:MAG: hypothetical protein IPM82_29250 [Saprospiraceae bacterium]|nr:hypothetical protein [Saprospiraceae bacterium]
MQRSDLHYQRALPQPAFIISQKPHPRAIGHRSVDTGTGLFQLHQPRHGTQASLRAKEVGVRKTLGGNRGQLVGQF